MKLFDFIDTLTGDKRKWNSVSKKDKNENFFMLNRFMSINFPYIANLFNSKWIDGESAGDCWRDVMSTKYTKTPSWMYTKTKKKEKIKEWEPLDATVEFWMTNNQVSTKEFDHIKQVNKEELYLELKEIEQIFFGERNGRIKNKAD